MKEDYRSLNPMAHWLLPKTEPGLQAVERLKVGITELSRLPKAAPEINNFRSLHTCHAKYRRSNKNNHVKGLMDEHHAFLRKLKLDLCTVN